LDGVGGAAVEEGHESMEGFFSLVRLGLFFGLLILLFVFGVWGCGWLVVFLNTSCCFEESGGMGSFEVGKMWTKSLHVKEKYICHIHRNIYIYALYTQY